ncbi:hypothetical protein BC827DRAFT_520427 [Russula dissimulans]|nr:hypothetical protein BC827DRAFT_520427 [Russula dissimulans]
MSSIGCPPSYDATYLQCLLRTCLRFGVFHSLYFMCCNALPVDCLTNINTTQPMQVFSSSPRPKGDKQGGEQTRGTKRTRERSVAGSRDVSDLIEADSYYAEQNQATSNGGGTELNGPYAGLLRPSPPLLPCGLRGVLPGHFRGGKREGTY